jgi:hypothetical protein
MPSRRRTRRRSDEVAAVSDLSVTASSQALSSPRTPGELGALVRSRIDEYDLPVATVARQIGWDGRQRLDNILRGKSISTDVRAWVLLARRLGLDTHFLVGAAWDLSSEPFPVRLPMAGPQRTELLRLLIEQHAGDLPPI